MERTYKIMKENGIEKVLVTKIARRFLCRSEEMISFPTDNLFVDGVEIFKISLESERNSQRAKIAELNEFLNSNEYLESDLVLAVDISSQDADVDEKTHTLQVAYFYPFFIDEGKGNIKEV